MATLTVFNSVSLDGYFSDVNGDMSWAHRHDPEWMAFVAENSKGESHLLFGRVTYQMMERFWPSAEALARLPAVATAMNNAPKTVFSRTLEKAVWKNTELLHGDLESEVRKLKRLPGPNITVLGSGTIVAQLAQAGLVDEFQLVVNPVILGKGKSLFSGVKGILAFKSPRIRSFGNGNVLMCYRPQ